MKAGDRVRIIDTKGIADRYKDRLGTIRRIYESARTAEVDVDDMDTPTLYLSRLELVVEPNDWQPGDRAYCEEPGHPAQGCLVEVKGPYEFDADRLTVYGLSGKTYHAAKQYLRRESSVPRQPAPQPSRLPPSCPCASSKEPGYAVGFFGDRVVCPQCNGDLVLWPKPEPVQAPAIKRYVDVQIDARSLAKTFSFLPKLSTEEHAIASYAMQDSEETRRLDRVIKTLSKLMESETQVFASMCGIPRERVIGPKCAKEFGEALHRALEHVVLPKEQSE